jgi:hypothetical protein
MTARSGRLLLYSAVVAAVWAALIALIGGFSIDFGPVHLTSRDPLRPLAVATALFGAAWLLLPRETLRRELLVLTGDRDRAAARIACAAAIATLIVAITWNTRAAGGSDSSCYILQADAFARRAATLRDPLARAFPERGGALFAPTGFLASPVMPAEAVPICGPGLAMIMAGFPVIGLPQGVFWVVPIAGALTVWLTFLFARRVADANVGAASAVVVATSPIFLYQSVQPMSDVPAAALWMAAMIAAGRGDSRGDTVSGVCFSLAVLTRPNLAPLAIPLGALLWRSPARVKSLTRFTLAAVPGLVAFAWLNTARYGSPFVSGYGETSGLFALSHVLPNLVRYARWLLETETPLIALAFASPFTAWRAPRRSATLDLTLASLAAIAIVIATYLAYTVFDDWWYIRFLLPVLPLLLALSFAVANAMIPGTPRRRAWWLAAICAMLTSWSLHVARQRQVFALQALESRFLLTGEYAARALPPEAVVLAVQQSGSIRYHGGRTTMMWDAIEPHSLDATIAQLRGLGRHVFVALEDWEESRFRERFVGQQYGALEWPPMAQIDRAPRVRLYDVAHRDRYRSGERFAIEHVRSPADR